MWSDECIVTPAALRLAACGVALALLAAPAPVESQELRASVGAVSDYVVHGLTRSRGDPAVQGELSLAADTGTALGVWASTVNLNPGPGADAEYALFLSQRLRANLDFAFDFSVSRYFYPDASGAPDYDYTELRAGLAFRDSIELSVAYSPGWWRYTRYGRGGDDGALWADLAAAYPLGSRLRLTGGVGYADLSDDAAGGYAYFSAGAEWRWRRLILGLVYVGTDDDGDHLYGDQAADGLVGSLIWVIH